MIEPYSGQRFRTKPGKRSAQKNRVLVVVRVYVSPEHGGIALVYRYEDREPISKNNSTCSEAWFLEHHEPIPTRAESARAIGNLHENLGE